MKLSGVLSVKTLILFISAFGSAGLCYQQTHLMSNMVAVPTLSVVLSSKHAIDVTVSHWRILRRSVKVEIAEKIWWTGSLKRHLAT